jgi:hypothetical protein
MEWWTGRIKIAGTSDCGFGKMLSPCTSRPADCLSQQRIAVEQKVIISSLAELGAEVQLAGACLAGKYSRLKLNRCRRALLTFPEIEPFDRADLPSQLYQVALRQQRIADNRTAGRSIACISPRWNCLEFHVCSLTTSAKPVHAV